MTLHVVATLGSTGDLYPFLAVARTLKERGEQVLFLSHAPYRDEVEHQGLSFEPILSTRQHQTAQCHPHLWHPINGFGVLWRYLAVPSIDPVVDCLKHLVSSQSEPIQVFASPLVVGARLARDLLPIHLVTGLTAPANLRSDRHPMFLGRHTVPGWIPDRTRRALWRWLDRQKLQPMAEPVLNRWRATQGLKPLRDPIFDRWLHSPDALLALFPKDFGPMSKDWPNELQFAGFPLYETDVPSFAELSPEVAEFCGRDPGKPLLIFYPGSVPTARLAEMCQLEQEFAARGCRTIVLGSQLEPRMAHQSEDRLMLRSAHLPSLLPHANLFIHHGGIGAIAQGIAARVNQLAMPAAYDQYDNAWRLRHCGHGSMATTIRAARETIHRALQDRQPQSPKRPSAEWMAKYSRPGSPNAAVLRAIDVLHERGSVE